MSDSEPAESGKNKADSSTNAVSTFLVEVTRIRDEWRAEDKKKADCQEDSDDFKPTQLWFRGVDCANHELKPEVYRKREDKLRKFPVKEPDEDEIRHGFKSRAIQLMPTGRLPENDKEWYFLMRHYGAPTRLLDWTDGALLALYFAVTTLTEPHDVAVWVLDPKWLNKKFDHPLDGVALPEWSETSPWFPKPFEEELYPQTPLAIDPPHIAPRVAVQRSHFTNHGKDPDTNHGKDLDGLDKLAKESSSRLVKITIPGGDVIEVLDDLRTFGISETTVYPALKP
jgi:hypothetical protein